MKIFISLLFTLFSFTTFAQTHPELIQKANKLYSDKNYAESSSIFAAAFKIEEGNNSDYYNAACSAALAGQEKQAFTFLKKSAEKGWKGYAHMHKDTDLKPLWEKDEWQPIATKVQANLDEFEKNFDKPLKAELEEIYVRDQTLRKLFGDVEKKFGNDSEEMKYFKRLTHQEDSLCLLAVVKIIEEHGWPGKNLVGNKANTSVFLVIQHAPLPIQEKYLPLLKESVKKGESRGSGLALMEDRVEMRNDRPQIYGSQLRRNKETDKYELYDLKDPEYVNKRRAEVGLKPLADYLKNWDIEWTVEQKN